MAIYTQRSELPAATVGTTGINVLMGILSAFFCFCACAALTTGRFSAADDYLNLTFAANTRRALGALFAAALTTSGIAAVMFVATVGASQSWEPAKRLEINGQTIGYLVLLLAPFLLSALNAVIGWVHLRPPKTPPQAWPNPYGGMAPPH
ncbi:hypothetical protein QFW96_02205 [Saccharopolyspora sp. TS4A08]|uniref:Uncharacterized protein n=1 Tax=Saccharopolyspora ipomoeae TaxID=3042027 RepID=A0ABT6PHC8_9PSEU|nr:hypothetical protein [Saccharopolyspora sp. TS4A08]MDI2027400.1 hypothetical protein [Saccharopolyspora sp. TS4A08]